MKGRDFMRYLVDRTKNEEPAYIDGGDPAVEMYDGTVRVFDQRGESCSLRSPLPRQLRALALQLQLCADEIERRGYEGEAEAEAKPERFCCSHCGLIYAGIHTCLATACRGREP